jgi:predicted nucleic acid-binding protein
VSGASLEEALPEGERVLVDSSTLIAYLQGSEPVSPLAVQLVDDLVRSGRNPATVSMVSVMELLIRPHRRSEWHYLHTLDFLTHHPNFRAQPIDLPVAQEAAGIRATYGLPAPDALVVATGIVAQVGALVTNDERWKKRLRPLAGRVKVLYLDDFRLQA